MSKNREKNNQKGAAMVISVLILSVVMLSIAITSSTSFIRELQIIQIIRSKKVSLNTAIACNEVAMNNLGRNANYTGNEVIDVEGNSCTILTINPGPPWEIKVEANYNNKYTKIKTILSSRNPIIIDSWEEVSSF